VEISAALAADLKALTEVLDIPGVDLAALLESFSTDTGRAIDSYLGLRMTLVIDGLPVTFTLMESTTAATSLRVPLNRLGVAEAGSVLMLYASNPGAFVDLAADLSFALGLRPDTLILDDDLRLAGPARGVDGLVELAQVNQAIGILIDRGHRPAAARAELRRLADHAETTVHTAARQLIATTQTGPSPDGAAG
jgi:hypothetical protein